jgi:hypothetical protein
MVISAKVRTEDGTHISFPCRMISMIHLAIGKTPSNFGNINFAIRPERLYVGPKDLSSSGMPQGRPIGICRVHAPLIGPSLNSTVYPCGIYTCVLFARSASNEHCEPKP